MLDKAPEDGGFKFRSGFVVNRHRRYLAVSLQDIDIKWELSQILPYRSANRALTGGDSAVCCLKNTPGPLTVSARLREIINDLI
jgi:hypothetical protein